MDAFVMNDMESQRDDRTSQRYRALHFNLRTLPRPLRIIRNKFRPKIYSPTPHSPTLNPTRIAPGSSPLTQPTSPQARPHPPAARTSQIITFRRPSFFSIRSSSTGTRSSLSSLGRWGSKRKVEPVEVVLGEGEGEGGGDGEGAWWCRGGVHRKQLIESAENDEYVRWVQWENDW